MVAVTITNADVKAFYSTFSIGELDNLGGARSTEEISDNRLYNLLSKTTEEEQRTGIVKYRCFYIYNDNEKIYIKNPALFVVSDTTSPNDFVEVGWGTSKIGNGVIGSTDGSIEQELETENTEPEDVQFFKGNVRSEGAILNADLPPQKGKAVWVRYTSLFNAQDVKYNTFRIRLVADNVIKDLPAGPPPPAQILFNVFGECSSDDDFTTLANTMIPQNPHFFVTVGDNNIDSNPSFFLGVMGINIAKTMLALGPMDVTDATVTNAYLNEIAKYPFIPSIHQRFYSKTFGNVHILVMDTSGLIPYTNPSPQYSFVKKDLEDAFTNGNIDWIFVVTNRSMYGSQTTSATRYFYDDIKSAYHDMFTKNGVLVVFQGTFRYYERSKVLKYNIQNVAQPQTYAYDGPLDFHISGKKSFQDGCIFITVGTGGDVHDLIATPATYTQYWNTVDWGYVKVLVENALDHKRVSIRFYETSRSASIFVDGFTITRTDS